MRRLICALILLGGCFAAAPAEEFRWSVKAPSKVSAEGRLHFTVETHVLGDPVYDVPYVWRVDWVGVPGIRHQGRSFHPESILVKGDTGSAQLRILACRGGLLHEVANAPFEVLPGSPPAD